MPTSGVLTLGRTSARARLKLGDGAAHLIPDNRQRLVHAHTRLRQQHGRPRRDGNVHGRSSGGIRLGAASTEIRGNAGLLALEDRIDRVLE